MRNPYRSTSIGRLLSRFASQDVEILNFSKPPETPPATAQLPVEAAGLKPQVLQPPPAPVAAAPVPPTPKPVVTPADPAAPAEVMER